MALVRPAIAMQEADAAYLDESLELQDPYSDLSLFLSRKVKEQMTLSGGPKKWSLPLQDKLLEKISVEFQKKFPRYRLAAAPLRKVWDKVVHFSELFEKKQNALTPDGKLNVHFLVRENLKTVLAHRNKEAFHPFLLAQQLALKVGESVATLEGVKPAIQNLTTMIWSAEQHLLPFSERSFPPLDTSDRLVIKWMLDSLTEYPEISQHELLESLQKKCEQFQSLKELKQSIPWLSLLSMEWAYRLFPSCPVAAAAPLLQKLRAWIEKHLPLFSLNDAEHLIQDLKTAYLLEQPNLPISLYEFEIICWCHLREKLPRDPSLDSLIALLLKEALSQLIDKPDEHWRSALQQALDFFIKAHDICKTWSSADCSRRLLYWSLQGELVLCLLRFPETPFFHLVQEARLLDIDEARMTAYLREQFLSRYTSPLLEPTFVHQKADLLRRYSWYHQALPHETTFDRWILLHEQTVHHLDLQTRIEHLISRAQKELPLLPLDRKTVLRACSIIKDQT